MENDNAIMKYVSSKHIRIAGKINEKRKDENYIGLRDPVCMM